MERDKVFATNLIITTTKRRGSGNSLFSPIRIITEIFTLKGDKIAEYDKYTLTAEQIEDTLKSHVEDKELLQLLLDKFNEIVNNYHSEPCISNVYMANVDDIETIEYSKLPTNKKTIY